MFTFGTYCMRVRDLMTCRTCMYVFEPMKHIATLHLLYYLTLANGATLHQYKKLLA